MDKKVLARTATIVPLSAPSGNIELPCVFLEPYVVPLYINIAYLVRGPRSLKAIT